MEYHLTCFLKVSQNFIKFSKNALKWNILYEFFVKFFSKL